MTAPAPITCPECGGEQMANHPAGALVFQHTSTCSLGIAEDSTQIADSDRARVLGPMFTRPATEAERTLLSAWPTPVPAVLWCRVTYVTASIRRRTFK